MTTHRNNNFDAVRILAALVVIFGHAHPLSGATDATVLGNAVQSIAVKIFFVVSGFLVAKSWQADPHLVRYLMRRGMRLIPGLALVLFLTVFVLGPMSTELTVPDYFKSRAPFYYFIYNIFLYPAYSLPGVFLGNPYPGAVNGSLWSLPVEVFMYLLLPMLFALTLKNRVPGMFIALTCAMCCMALEYLAYTSTHVQIIVWGTGLRSVADVGPYFFVGSLYALTSMKRWLDAPIALFVIAVAALFQPKSYLAQQIILLIALPYAVLSFATLATPLVSRVGLWGDPSYGIYLYGFPIQQAFFHLMGRGMGVTINAVLASIVALLFGYGSWHVIEKRVLAMKPAKRAVAASNNLQGIT
jgi:peptidoglycan/LPS O-acetylase OafA/YrhL